jgi:alpha-tubulin suppressor-like RCC1 family protein
MKLHRLLIAMPCLVTGMVACDNSTDPVRSSSTAASPIVLQQGMMATLNAPDSVGAANVEWSSSNNSLVTVDQSGNVQAIAEGAVAIFARAGSVSESTTVTVRPRDGLLSSAVNTTCGIATDGNPLCWENAFVPSTRGANAISIALSNHTACFLVTSGTASCWGENYFGEVGIGSRVPDPVQQATPVAGGNLFIAIYSGGTNDDLASQCLDAICGYTTCALTSDGTPWCWGYDVLAGSFPTATFPKALATNLKFESMGVGAMFFCGVTFDKNLYCAGNNRTGQLGRGPGVTDGSFMPVTGDVRYEMVSTGATHACAVAEGGNAFCWGSNDSGQLGTSSTESCRLSKVTVSCSTHPVQVSGPYHFKSISAGSSTTDYDAAHIAHSCGITTDNDVVCWGYNAFGQLGNGTKTDSPVPVIVSGGFKFRRVSVARTFTCGVTTGGVAMCWGQNGQTSALSPQPVSGGFVFR